MLCLTLWSRAHDLGCSGRGCLNSRGCQCRFSHPSRGTGKSTSRRGHVNCTESGNGTGSCSSSRCDDLRTVAGNGSGDVDRTCASGSGRISAADSTSDSKLRFIGRGSGSEMLASARWRSLGSTGTGTGRGCTDKNSARGREGWCTTGRCRFFSIVGCLIIAGYGDVLVMVAVVRAPAMMITLTQLSTAWIRTHQLIPPDGSIAGRTYIAQYVSHVPAKRIATMRAKTFSLIYSFEKLQQTLSHSDSNDFASFRLTVSDRR